VEISTLVGGAAIVVASYLIGGIPWSVLIARLTGAPDPRTLGSGRTGGANALRAFGPRIGLVSGLLDMLKGTAAVLLARQLGGGPWLEVLAAGAAIVGHSRSPFLGFKGGRGVSVAYGALLVLSPIVALAVIPVYIVILLWTGYSSLGSLIGSLVGGIGLVWITLASGGPPAYLAYAVAGTTLIWVFHIDNIQRLLSGTERKLEWRKKSSGSPPGGPGAGVPSA
jgi:glycerol-3-phosphate acyltransferase PlsY